MHRAVNASFSLFLCFIGRRNEFVSEEKSATAGLSSAGSTVQCPGCKRTLEREKEVAGLQTLLSKAVA